MCREQVGEQAAAGAGTGAGAGAGAGAGPGTEGTGTGRQAEAEARGAWCVHCGFPTPELYRRYSDSVLKLVKCVRCGHIADKYVEYEPVIVLIDLVLLSKEACRHILLNGHFNSHWKLAVIVTLMDAYRIHSYGRPLPKRQFAMRLTDTFDLLDTDQCFYIVYLQTLLASLVYVAVVLLLSLVVAPARCKASPTPMLLWKAIVLAGSSIFLLIPALICGNLAQPELYWGLVVGYWFIAQVHVHHVASGSTRFLSAVIILAAVVVRRYAEWLVTAALTTWTACGEPHGVVLSETS